MKTPFLHGFCVTKFPLSDHNPKSTADLHSHIWTQTKRTFKSCLVTFSQILIHRAMISQPKGAHIFPGGRNLLNSQFFILCGFNSIQLCSDSIHI